MTFDDKRVIYSMVKVGKVHGTKQVLKDISLSYYYGAKIGVLGLNGSGKSTLLRIMAGVEREYIGETHLSEGMTVGYLPQEPKLDESKTVIEIVREAVAHVFELMKEFDAINARFAEDLSPDEMDEVLARQAKIQDRLDKLDAWSVDDRLNFAMEALRCPPPDQPVAGLSGGERRRVALCRLLIQDPDILLLDEPTNHLDAESVQWLERHLQAYKGTVIAVTHDRYFLDKPTEHVLSVAEQLLPREQVKRLTTPTLGGEDFAFYQQKVPGAFFFLGLDDGRANGFPSLHHPEFNFNDDALRNGIRMFVHLALTYSATAH